MSQVLDGRIASTTIANVACVWAYSQDMHAASALLLSDALADLRPSDAIVHRAQGLILTRQRRWNLAAKYLESAAKAMPRDYATHNALGQCYEAMGMPNEAAEQRSLATAATQPATVPSAR